MRLFVVGGHLITCLGGLPWRAFCYLMTAERALVGPRRRARASRLQHVIYAFCERGY